PERIKAELVGEARQPDLLVPRLIVAHALPAISGEHHLDADVHNPSCSRDLLETYDGQLTKSWVSSPPRKWGPEPAPGLNRGATAVASPPWIPAFRGNDEKGRRSPGNFGFILGEP